MVTKGRGSPVVSWMRPERVWAGRRLRIRRREVR
jgi:hypothetical protein